MWNEQACLHIWLSYFKHIQCKHTYICGHWKRNMQTQANMTLLMEPPVEISSKAVKHKYCRALAVLDSVFIALKSLNMAVYYYWFCTVQRSWKPGPYGVKGAGTKEFCSCLTSILSISSKARMSNNVSLNFSWVNFLPNIVRSCLWRRHQKDHSRMKHSRRRHVSIFSSLSSALSAPVPHGSGPWPAVTCRSPFSSTNTDVTRSLNSDLLPLPLISDGALQLVHFTPDVLTPFCSLTCARLQLQWPKR